MAWSVLIWKIYGFPKVSLNLERFVLKHATAHIHKRYPRPKDHLGQLKDVRKKFYEKNVTLPNQIKMYYDEKIFSTYSCCQLH